MNKMNEHRPHGLSGAKVMVFMQSTKYFEK